jgi:hypothetical protein
VAIEKTKDEFTQVQGKRKQGPKKPIITQAKAPSTSNSFEILNQTLGKSRDGRGLSKSPSMKETRDEQLNQLTHH